MPKLLLPFLCMFFAACTGSNVPITSAKPQPADAVLIGQWRMNLNEMGEEETQGEMDVVDISLAPDGQLRVLDVTSDGTMDERNPMVLVTATIGGKRYASLGAIDEESKKSHYMLMRYEIESRDRVQAYSAPFEQLADAVKKGWILGKEVPDRHFTTFMLDTNEEQLRGFIASHGKRIFSVKGLVIERVESVTPRRP